MADRPHGYARYKLDRCRCYTCGWAVAQYRDHVEQLQRRGLWQPYVDAEPSRQHVLQLKACGFGDRSIADLAGLDRKRVRDLLHGRPERGTPPPTQIRPATAAAILSVEPTFDNLPGATPVASTGTVRRLQALVAAGWPQSQLAARLGLTDSNFASTLRREQVLVRTVRAVRALYTELWLADPAELGVPATSVSRSRNHAISNGWAPPGAWDEGAIDDPQAAPDWTGECGTPAGYSIHYRIGVPPCQRCRDARAARRKELAGTAA
jgi:transcriptional regulator with XRE-family HTH domain